MTIHNLSLASIEAGAAVCAIWILGILANKPADTALVDLRLEGLCIGVPIFAQMVCRSWRDGLERAGSLPVTVVGQEH